MANPAKPEDLWKLIRNARMGAELKINEFAQLLGVTEDTIIYWELRRMRRGNIERAKAVIGQLGNRNIDGD